MLPDKIVRRKEHYDIISKFLSILGAKITLHSKVVDKKEFLAEKCKKKIFQVKV